MILILVSLHELGHLLAARWYGVEAVRFSVGFSKPFFTKKCGDTGWCLAPIPLGGYVKMVDAREGSVAGADLPLAFGHQHPAKHIATAAAGPLTNLTLAVVLRDLSFSSSITEIHPYVGTVEPVNIATIAGFVPEDRILSVNDEAVKDWSGIQTEVLLEVESRRADVAVRTASGQQTTRVIDAMGMSETDGVIKNGGNIGLWPFKTTTRLGLVTKNGPMERAELRVDDHLLTADGKPIERWLDWADLFRRNPSSRITIGYERGGRVYEANVRPDAEEPSDGTLVSKAGTAPQHDEAWNKRVYYQYMPSVPEAFKMDWNKMTSYSLITVEFFGELMAGRASPNHVSSPLTIADMAGRSAALGIQSYLEFLALISVNLDVINLLPVPVLDGGHLVYYTTEWIRGKPLSERIRAIGLRFGLAAILILMLVTSFNDINRLFG